MPGQPLYLSRSVSALEQAARQADPTANLMERAGLAAAQLARKLLGENGTSVLIYAGPGNNGGDAFVVARHLRQWFYRVKVVFVGDAAKLPADAAQALRSFAAAGGGLSLGVAPGERFDLIIDGLFGIGLKRALGEPYAGLVQQINAANTPVLALDVPSGLSADTGAVMGVAVRAQHTVSFIAHKPGLLTLDGADHCGTLHLDNLGLQPSQLVPPDGWSLEHATVHGILKPRLHNTHKGTYGNVIIIGSDTGMVGAVLLAGRAALHCGAGRVYVGLLGDDAPAVDLMQPELMLRSAETALAINDIDALVVGPGMGQSERARRLLDRAVQKDAPLILDADALNLIAAHAPLAGGLARRKAATLITPHPSEAARLLQATTAQVQSDRIAAAVELARRYNAVTVLKGAGSICATPTGEWHINTSGNPGMAAAGMGDVLSGMLGAFIAQGVDARRAILLGVYLHGRAADLCVAQGVGPSGLTASDVIYAAREEINTRMLRIERQSR